LDENNMRYFRFASMRWKCSSVEGFKTIAQRTTRAGFMKTAHKPATIRSVVLRLGDRERD
jgi:hypothetical protein